MAEIKSKRVQHLVEVAENLFYENGFHATGIDLILQTSGVAKMTLYNHFGSKEALIVAVLENASQHIGDWLLREIEANSLTDQSRIDALFDVHEKWFGSEAFKGCLFTKACSEFPDVSHPAHKAASDHFKLVFRIVERQAKAAGASDPAAVAENIMLLLEGSKALAFAAGAPIAARRAKRAARVMMAG